GRGSTNNLFLNMYVALGQRSDKWRGRDATLLRERAALGCRTTRHRLRDDGGGKSGRAHHRAETCARVEAINDVVAQRLLLLIQRAAKLQADEDDIGFVCGQMTHEQFAEQTTRRNAPAVEFNRVARTETEIN